METPTLERVFQGTFSDDEVWNWIEGVLDANPELKVRGIRVSNSLHERGIAGECRGIPIAMSPGLYPADEVRIILTDQD